MTNPIITAYLEGDFTGSWGDNRRNINYEFDLVWKVEVEGDGLLYDNDLGAEKKRGGGVVRGRGRCSVDDMNFKE